MIDHLQLELAILEVRDAIQAQRRGGHGVRAQQHATRRIGVAIEELQLQSMRVWQAALVPASAIPRQPPQRSDVDRWPVSRRAAFERRKR